MSVNVIALTNPITGKRASTTVEPGKPLSERLKTPEGAVISRNGESYWDEPLEDGDLINIIIPPRGGESGKDMARTGIVMAAMIGAGAAFPGSSVGMLALRAGVTTAAAIGANALIPPRL